MILAAKGGPGLEISDEEADALFSEALARALKETGGTSPARTSPRTEFSPRVLVLPPDITRFHSKAGFFTDIAARELGPALGAVMPALGTHMALTDEEKRRMFSGTPAEKFLVHDWRNGVVTLGRIEGSWVREATEGRVGFDWPVQVNKILRDGGFSMIVSIGQVVPHEVVGMANHTKNLFVGTGGKEAIDKSHFAGASYGMERMMGRTDTPVRALFDEGARRFGDLLPPVLYVLTVMGPKSGGGNSAGPPVLRGIYIGFGRECFEEAAALAREVNVSLLDEPIRKAVVYLEPGEFRTTWLGNKAVYRTRMAMDSGGELLILAPGLERFGEDLEVDRLIRKFGYRPANAILEMAEKERELADNLSVAAHLIHGSSERRFTVRYCPGPGLSRTEIESVGYEWGSLCEALARYDVKKLKAGPNTMSDGEKIFFIPNPALGLWAERKRFLS